MNFPKISIILATYNRRGYLENAIKNLLKQTFRDFELILINDCSTDGTKEICDKFAESDRRIRVSHLPANKGTANARELGVQTAAAEYITFVDDDDIYAPTLLEFLYGLITEHGADISICGSVNSYSGNIQPLYVYDELLIMDKIRGLEEFLKREKFHTAPPTKLFKRTLFDDIAFLPDRKIDDIHVVYKVFAEAEKVVARGIPLYTWVKHGENMSGYIQTNKLKPEILDEYLLMQRERVAYLSEKVPEIKERARYAALSYMLSMCDKIKTYGCDDCKKQYDYMSAYISENINEFLSSPFITEREKALLSKHIPNLQGEAYE